MDPKSALSEATVLVTGGTGFTGSNLLRTLTAADVKVRCIARPSSHIPADLANSVEWYRGEVFDGRVVSRAMDGVHYVFHVAACFRDAGADEEEYRNVHVRSTQLLAEAAVRQRNFKRFVHTSTVGVHGHVADPPGDESSPFKPGDIYQETKLEGELWIRSFAEDERLPLSVVRPAAIMGPGDRRLLKLVKIAKTGLFPLLDGQDTLYHLIYVDDLTACMLQLAIDPRAVGEVFICGNAQSTSLREMMAVIGEVLGKQVRFMSLPSKPLFAVVDVIESVSHFLNLEPFIYRRRLAFFSKDRSFDTHKLRELLNFQYRYDNVAGLRKTVEWYRDAGWI